MSIDQHVSVTLTINNSGVSRQGFGTIGVMTYKALFAERSRTYRRASDIIADGYAASSPEVLAALSILGQSPHPPTIKLLRGTLAPTQRYLLLATPKNNFKYVMEVVGEGVTTTEISYTSSANATTAEIHNGLLLALNAVVGKNYTAAFEPLVLAPITFTATNADEIFHAAAHGLQLGDRVQVSTSVTLPAGLLAATDYFVIPITVDTFYLATTLALAIAGTHLLISSDGAGVQTLSSTGTSTRPADAFTATGSLAGNWFSLEVKDTSAIAITQNHADPGIATDLAAIQTADSDWYYLKTCFNSKLMLKATAAYIEATAFKAFIFDSVDSDGENVAALGGGCLDDFTALSYKRTLPAYHRKPNEMWDAGWAGRLAPLNVGRWTAAYKTIIGSTPDKFTATQTTNLDAKKASYYKSEASRSITWEGKVANASFAFLDVTVALDFVLDDIQKSVFGLLVALDKLAYTDEDIKMVEGAIEGAIDRAKSDAHKIVAPGTPGDPNDPQPTVVFPRVRDIDPSVRALRELPDGDVSFRLQGAVHTVQVNLTVTF